MTPCDHPNCRSSCASAASKYSRRTRASDATTRRISSPCSRATSIASSSSRASTSGLRRRRGHHPSHLGPGAPEGKGARRRRDPCTPLARLSQEPPESPRNLPGSPESNPKASEHDDRSFLPVCSASPPPLPTRLSIATQRAGPKLRASHKARSHREGSPSGGRSHGLPCTVRGKLHVT